MICIHPRPGSFSDRWIEICEQRKIPFITLDLLESNVLQRLCEVRAEAVLFHLHYADPTVELIGKHLSKTIEMLGIKVFPNDRTCWHFDDKLAQKYLFEALRIVRCPTYCFYTRQAALDWASTTSYPKVWKLKTGAASDNVRLVRSEAEAGRLIQQAFGRGFQSTPPVFGDFSTKVFKHKRRRDWLPVLRRLPRTLWDVSIRRRNVPRERSYVYFQEFLPGNDYDTRVTVIGNRAFAYRRFVRQGDFRASGSGRIDWDPKGIDLQCVMAAFESIERLGAQCLAFDFVYDLERKPVVLEVSYGFIPAFVHDCPGFWDRTMAFHSGNVWPQDAILDDLLQRA